MTILELIAENYRQHRKLHVKFEGNTVGLIGENGTGKSNCLKALNYAFSGALSGETRDSDTNQLPIIKWGAKSGFVKVTFEHLGKKGTILREFSHSKADAHFDYDGMKCSGTVKVNTVVAEILGMDKDVCRQAVFVAQDELDSILFTEPSNRKLAWQKLCGIGQVGEIHKKMGKFISELPPIHDYSESIRDAEHQLVDLEDQLVSTSTTLATLRLSAPAGDLKSLEDKANTIRRILGIQREVTQLNSEVAVATAKLQEAENALAALKSSWNVTQEVSVEKLAAEVDKLSDAKASMEMGRTVVDQVTKLRSGIAENDALLKAALANLGALPTEAEIENSLKAIKALDSEISGIHAAIAMYETLKRSVTDGSLGDNQCKLCGQGLASPEDVRNHVAKKSDELKALKELKVKELSDLNPGRVEGYRNARVQFTVQVKNYKDVAEGQRINLETLLAKGASFDQTKYANVLSELTVAKNNLANCRSKSQAETTYETTIKHYREAIAATNAKVTVLVKEAKQVIAASGGSISPVDFDAQLAAVATAQQDLHKSLLEVATLEGAVSQLNKSIATLKDTIARLRKSQHDQESTVRKLDVLKDVRDWFHYDNGPSIIINNLLDEITVATNDFLSKFDSTFVVVPNYQSMSFNYYYHNPDIPISDPYPHCSEMSGGEKVVLAVAFRLATYAMFAQRVGLLVLDEPSVYLDSKNVVKLGTLLYNIKTLAKKLGLQVLISTHEKSLMNHFDSIIDFGTKDNPSFG